VANVSNNFPYVTIIPSDTSNISGSYGQASVTNETHGYIKLFLLGYTIDGYPMSSGCQR